MFSETFGKDGALPEEDLDQDTQYREFHKSAELGGGLTFHCFEQQKTRSALVPIFSYLIANLTHHRRRFGPRTISYEMLSVVVDTGYEGFKVRPGI